MKDNRNVKELVNEWNGVIKEGTEYLVYSDAVKFLKNTELTRRETELIKAIDKAGKFSFAYDGESEAVFIKGDKKILDVVAAAMRAKADESDIENGALRLWWD